MKSKMEGREMMVTHRKTTEFQLGLSRCQKICQSPFAGVFSSASRGSIHLYFSTVLVVK